MPRKKDDLSEDLFKAATAVRNLLRDFTADGRRRYGPEWDEAVNRLDAALSAVHCKKVKGRKKKHEP